MGRSKLFSEEGRVKLFWTARAASQPRLACCLYAGII